MELESSDTSLSKVRVKATLRLGTETYTVNANAGLLSEQLVTMKDESMSILKDYITKHNAPADIPDEPLDGGSSGEEDEKPPVKSKKRK